MSDRTLKSRLLFDISDIRKELTKEVQELKPEELDYVPREGVHMKSIRALLEEIGAMEAVTVHMITDGKELDWGEVLTTIAMAGVDPQGALKALATIRATTERYLESTGDDALRTPIALPESWHQYFNSPVVEPEELVRWVGKHEYYHLGQIITYKWISGYSITP